MSENCVFCDRRQFEERLVHETENFNIIATLGQITDGGYVLLAPKEHVLCTGAFSPQQIAESSRLGSRICDALIREYVGRWPAGSPWPITVFEHGIVGQTIQHAHIHFLPTPINMTTRVRADFQIAEIDELQRADHLQKIYAAHSEPYLFWTSGGKGVVCWNPPAPKQYLRIVAADLLGRPERANWRTMDQELDRRL